MDQLRKRCFRALLASGMTPENARRRMVNEVYKAFDELETKNEN